MDFSRALRKTGFCSSLLTLLLFSGVAKSQVFTGTIAGGIGGAGRATVDGGEGGFLNPAAVGHLQQYYFGAHYNRGSHPRDGDFSRYAIQIADGTPTNIIPGAFSYYRQSIDLPAGGNRIDTDYALTLANKISGPLALGVQAHYFANSGQGREDSQINGNIGLLITPNESFGLGLVGYDIAPVTREVSTPDRRLTPTLALGAHYMLPEILRLRLDLVRPDIQALKTYRVNVMTGIETFFRPEFAIRLGAQWLEVSDQMNLTAGFGFHGPRLSLDYAFQKDIRSAGGVRHLVDLWMPL